MMENNKENKNDKRSFTVNVDGVGYEVTATPFDFNAQVRYNVTVNHEEPAVFAWDSEMSMFKSLSDDTSTYPDGLMRGINDELLKTN